MRRNKENPKLIVKQGFAIDDRLGDNTPIPEIVMLGNAAGLRWLSSFFHDCADRAEAMQTLSRDAAKNAHDHLEITWKPFLYSLCDHLDIRIVPITAKNQRYVFKKHAVSRRTAKRNNLADRSEELVAQANAYLKKDR